MSESALEPIRDCMPTRLSLIHRIKDVDDSKSWVDFFDTYWKLIYSVAIKYGLKDQEAQEVVQETIISVSRNISKFNYVRGHSSFKSWLLSMTRWRIHDQYRKQYSREEFPDPHGEVMDRIWEEAWKDNLEEAATERVKVRVDPKHFQIYTFHTKKQMPAKKIARIFGLSFGQVYLIKYRILSQIKKEVRKLDS